MWLNVDGREMLLPLHSLVRRQVLDGLLGAAPCVAAAEADIIISLRRQPSFGSDLLIATATALCADPQCSAAR